MRKGLLYILILLSYVVFAQEKDKTLPKANEEYAQKNFVDAEADYRISSSKFPKKSVAAYNLGNAIYEQKQIAEAKYAYAKAIENSKSRTQKHRAYHNLGNVFMKEKNYTLAVEAYKNALKNNPNDEETRYNFALAKKMLKENPPKNDKKDDKKDDKDKKDKKEEDKKEDNEDKKNDQNKNPGNQDKPKPSPSGISKERLENLLNAVNNEEEKIQAKVNAKKEKGNPSQTEKDW